MLLQLSDRIEYVFWSIRAQNALHNAGVEYFGQLVRLKKRDLLNIPNCGRITVAEIEWVLAHHGWHLGMQISLGVPSDREFIDADYS